MLLECYACKEEHQNQYDHQICLTRKIQELEQKLDEAADVVWDQAFPYMRDVEHQISSHSDTVPEQYRKLAAAVEKIADIVNFRPDPG